jgi:hypothetical protein
MKKRDLLIWLLLAAALFFAGWFVGGQKSTETAVEETTTHVDTIAYYQPMAKDSVIIRYETRKLPVKNGNNAGENIPEFGNNDTENIPDSANVLIPIINKVYQDSAYTAYISGYAVNLDSIEIYNRHDVTTIIQTPKSRHWYLGVTAGYAITPKGAQPYVGIGLTYSFLSF